MLQMAQKVNEVITDCTDCSSFMVVVMGKWKRKEKKNIGIKEELSLSFLQSKMQVGRKKWSLPCE